MTEWLKVKKLSSDAVIPSYAHSTDAGLDLYSTEDVIILPGGVKKVSTGLAFEIPPDCFGSLRDRSSMASKGVIVGGGVIDSGYRGEVKVVLINVSNTPLSCSKGSKIAQMIVQPYSQVKILVKDDLKPSSRGNKGFGSSGV